MRPLRWAAVGVSVLGGGWMLLDGSVGLLTRAYLGGELGPWAPLVRAVGVDPLSPAMAAYFVVHGLAWLAATAWYARAPSRGRPWLAGIAAASVWYAVVGTLVALVVVACLWRDAAPRSTTDG